MRYDVNVTQLHIDQGVRFSSCNCPVALALQDIGWKYPVAGPRYLFDQGRHFKVATPVVVSDWMKKYDSSPKPDVRPFSFTVEVEGTTGEQE